MPRSLTPEVFNDLKNGELTQILEMVKQDSTLNMEFRNDELSIYYRGGKLFKIYKNTDKYVCEFNHAYWMTGDIIDKKYPELEEKSSIQDCKKNKALYKDQMDYHIYKLNDPSAEAQVQQRIVFENNVLGMKNDKSGDYFFLDTEYETYIPENKKNAKFDAIALRWPTYHRNKHKGLGVSVIEIKNGDGALSGTAGIKDHIDDFIKFYRGEKCKEMCQDMQMVFKQKCELGLIPRYTEHYDKDHSYNIKIDETAVDMVFMFANRNPHGEKVEIELKKIIEKISKNDREKIYVANSSDVGYVLLRYKEKKQAKDRFKNIDDFLMELNSN